MYGERYSPLNPLDSTMDLQVFATKFAIGVQRAEMVGYFIKAASWAIFWTMHSPVSIRQNGRQAMTRQQAVEKINGLIRAAKSTDAKVETVELSALGNALVVLPDEPDPDSRKRSRHGPDGEEEEESEEEDFSDDEAPPVTPADPNVANNMLNELINTRPTPAAKPKPQPSAPVYHHPTPPPNFAPYKPQIFNHNYNHMQDLSRYMNVPLQPTYQFVESTQTVHEPLQPNPSIPEEPVDDLLTDMYKDRNPELEKTVQNYRTTLIENIRYEMTLDASAKKSKRTTLDIIDSIHTELKARGSDPKYLDFIDQCYYITDDEQTTLQQLNEKNKNVQIGDFEALKKKLKLDDDYPLMTAQEITAYRVLRSQRKY